MSGRGVPRLRGSAARSLRSEVGAGSVLTLAVMVVVVVISALTGAIGSACIAKQKVAGAADAAALAASDTALGLATGIPCERAKEAVRLAGVDLASCSVEGVTATVSARATFLGLPIRVAARAGPRRAESVANSPRR